MSVTKNSIYDIIVKKAILDAPVVQVAELRSKQEHCRAALSDGTYYVSALFGTNVKPLVNDGTIVTNSCIKLTKYAVTKNAKQPLVILQAEKVSNQNHLIGTPKNITDVLQNMPNEVPIPNDIQSIMLQNPSSDQTPNTSPNRVSSDTVNSSPGKLQLISSQQFQNNVYTLGELNQYSFNWSIIVRIVEKSKIREYKGQKEGKLFSITMKDKSNNEIKGTFFNTEVDRCYDLLEEGKVYQISGGKVKKANPKFNTTNNDFEITFDSTTTIKELNDDHIIPKKTLQFTKLKDINEMNPGRCINICAIVCTIYDKIEVTTKRMTKINKRRIEVCDNSNTKIEVILWGDFADNFSYNIGDIFVVKNAQVSDFHGKFLSLSSFSSQIIEDCNLPEISQIRKWWNSLDDKNNYIDNTNQSTVLSLSSYMQQNNDGVNSVTTLPSLDCINSRNVLQTDDQSDIFTIDVLVADVTNLKRAFYLACPNEQCHNVSVQQCPDGTYFCKKCNQKIQTPKARFILNIKVADHSGSTYISLLGNDKLGSEIMKMKAEDIQKMETKNIEEELRYTLLTRSLFEWYTLKVRAKLKTLDHSKKIGLTVLTGAKMNFAQRAKELYNMIQQYEY